MTGLYTVQVPRGGKIRRGKRGKRRREKERKRDGRRRDQVERRTGGEESRVKWGRVMV
jgi:hypothetical protein